MRASIASPAATRSAKSSADRMFRLTLTIHPGDEDDLVTRLHQTALSGLEQENRADGLVDFHVWFSTAPGAQDAAARLQNAHVRIDEVEDQNWNAAWQATWRPILAGQRWYLTPPGDQSATPVNRIRLEMHPGLAFGNGDHPTTQLCLIAMETLVRKGDIFLDAGCGSGLLGQAAHLLGAQAFGCDLDPTGLPSNSFVGSIDAIKTQSIDIAVMNIQAGTLIELWPGLARVTKREAILSGFLPDQADLIEAMIQRPWRVLSMQEQGGWCALVATSQ